MVQTVALAIVRPCGVSAAVSRLLGIVQLVLCLCKKHSAQAAVWLQLIPGQICVMVLDTMSISGFVLWITP